jgi:transcriptional regulator with XRE-family HTH domain
MRHEIGKRIRLVRDKKGITQSELGEKLGIQFQHVSKYERGETVPTWENLIKLHEFYDVNINWLLTGKGTMFVSPITYSVADNQSLAAIRDLDSDDQLDEIITELRNDQELKNLIYDYIKNYRQLRLTTSKLTDKVDRMKQKL